jgi:hypothetical protein
MARQIKSHDSWDGLTRSYAQFRTLREKGEEEEGKLKKDILGMLATQGEESPEGHMTLPSRRLKIGKKKVVGFRRQRRVSQTLDQVAAIAWLEANGLLAQCQATETYLNEDAIIGLNFQGTIPDTVFKSFYTEKETFALTLIEADDDDDGDFEE